MNTLEEFITNKSPEEINGIFIEQQTRFNRYVKLNYDCHGPLLQLSDFHDCYTVVFTEPIFFQKRKKKQSAAAGAAGALDDNYLNITGHFELHSSITALLQDRTEGPSSLHVKLEDYIDFLLPFRRSVDLKINHDDAGWTIDDDQRIIAGEHNGLVMTDGNVRLKKHGRERIIPFHVLLVNNLDIFTQFQNKVNIISGHNLSLSLVDENTLLFIYELLTDTTLSSKNRSERLKEIIDKLNETHQRVVNQTVSQLLYQINQAAAAAPAAPAAATVEHYLPDELRVRHPSYPEPETEFKLSVAQLSSTPKYYSMSCRYLLGGLSVVGTSDDDKFTCDKDKAVITDESLIKLVESLAFTISFRVDMRYNGDAYLFSFKLDREILNKKIVEQTTGGKCVFKHSDIVQHIVSESWKRCVIGALDKKASSLSRQREKYDTIKNIKDGIDNLWSERTIDLILDSCVVIDRCFTPSVEFTSSRLNLDFYSKVKGRDRDDSLILLPNPKDSHTRTSIVSLFPTDNPPDPVVNVYVRFSEIDVNDVLSTFLSKVPYTTSQVVRWIDAVNDYDESISTTLLQYNQGNDLSSVFSSVSRSLSRSLSLSRSPSHSRGHDEIEREHKGTRDRSIDTPRLTTSILSSDDIRLHEEHEQPITLEILERYINELPDGKSTQIPPNDCVSERGAASAPVGYFTRFKSALKNMITILFSRPTRDDDYAGMGGGHKPQKNTNTTIRRRNKKQSRKKYRYRIKQVKTKQRNKRKRTTYKK
jgi:hypothetical protein